MTYGNGAGFNANQAEVDEDYELYIQRGPVPEESLDYEYKFPSSAPLSSETHGGDDVGIWAIGIYGVFVILHCKTRNQKKNMIFISYYVFKSQTITSNFYLVTFCI